MGHEIKDYRRFPRFITVSEQRIAEFCQRCDHYHTESNSCNVLDDVAQARRVDEGLCQWALVNGQNVVMTLNGPDMSGNQFLV